MKNRMNEKESFDINYYQKFLNELYSDINQRRTFENIYGYLVRTSGYLGKAIVIGSPEQSKFIMPISWLLSLSTKLNIDLQESFCKKYPGICPHCLESQCVCTKTNKMPSRAMLGHKMNEELYFRYEAFRSTIKVFNFDQAVKTIMEIYTVNQLVWHISGPWRHVVKIYEEASEIHEAISGYEKKEKTLSSVADEIVDVLAWIVGAWGLVFSESSLDAAFTDYYFYGCPVCTSFPCKCDENSSRPTGLVDYKRLTTVKEKLDEIIGLLPDYKNEMSELTKSLDYVIHSQSEPIAKVVISQTKDAIEKIKNSIPSTDKDASNLQSPTTGNYYDVFLSYSTVDKDEARKIEAYLTKKKFKVFLSEKTIKPSEEWKDEIRNSLENSRLLCILATPNSLKSEWVTREQGAAWGLRIRILPILFQCSAKDLPEALKDLQAINFHEMAKIIDVLKNMS